MADTSLVFNILAKDKASKVFDKVKFAAAAAFAVGATAAVAFGKHALTAGAEVSAAMGATNQVFGASANTMLEWSKTTADSLGIARADALAAGKDFGAFFTAIGLTAPAAADLSKQWVTMSANMAAFRDVNPTQALEAMQSALRGELDPIQQFIPSLSAAAIEQRALAMSGKTATSELTQQEKALALNAIMLESTANKAGAAELAQNGFGVQTAKVQAKLKDTSAEIGQKLLPAALKLTNWALGAINWMKQHQTATKTIVIALGSFATIIGAIIVITKIWTAVQTALNIAMMLNPIGLIVIAIAALIAIIVLIATKTTWFQDLWRVAWTWIKDAVATAWNWIKTNWPLILSIITGPIGAAVIFIIRNWDSVVEFIKGLPGRIAAAASGMWDGIKNAFRSALNWIIGRWNALEFRVPGFSAFGQSFGGFTIGVPDIPFLDTGGTITRTGLAVVHRGEQVTPAQANPLSGGRSGPVVIDLRGSDDEFKRFFRAILRKNRDLLVVG